MPLIILHTRINAPLEICFDLARSIDLHQESMKHTGEQAVAGTTKGLIELGELVTWKAKHWHCDETNKKKLLNQRNHILKDIAESFFQLMHIHLRE